MISERSYAPIVSTIKYLVCITALFSVPKNLVPDLVPDLVHDLVPDLVRDLVTDLAHDLVTDLAHDLLIDLVSDLVLDLLLHRLFHRGTWLPA